MAKDGHVAKLKTVWRRLLLRNIRYAAITQDLIGIMRSQIHGEWRESQSSFGSGRATAVYFRGSVGSDRYWKLDAGKGTSI